jgi:hypothetical protein
MNRWQVLPDGGPAVPSALVAVQVHLNSGAADVPGLRHSDEFQSEASFQRGPRAAGRRRLRLRHSGLFKGHYPDRRG